MTTKQINGYRFEVLAGAESASWVIPHNIGTSAPAVECWIDPLSGSNFNTKILPQTVAATDANTVTITFSQPYAGIAYIV